VRIGADWVGEVLKRNGVPVTAMYQIRPGAFLECDDDIAVRAQRIWAEEDKRRTMRLVYWGRIHRPKGVHTLWEALALVPDLDVELAIVGDAERDNAYCRELRFNAERDPRIRLVGHIHSAQILPLLRTADVAVIPSRWHETGPITVFEARAAGLPIIGADRGGVRELCGQDSGSYLFQPEDPESLAAVIRDLAQEDGRLEAMRRSVKRPRTMDDVATEVAGMYADVVARCRPVSPLSDA